MESSSGIALVDLRVEGEVQAEDHIQFTHGAEFSLPQADGGKDAWLFLASCFIVEALVWGKLTPHIF